MSKKNIVTYLSLRFIWRFSFSLLKSVFLLFNDSVLCLRSYSNLSLSSDNKESLFIKKVFTHFEDFYIFDLNYHNLFLVARIQRFELLNEISIYLYLNFLILNHNSIIFKKIKYSSVKRWLTWSHLILLYLKTLI